jgi:hypothetical protein
MPDPASPLLDAARAWHDAGFCVIPSHEDGGKRPFGQWKKYQLQRPDWPTLEGWLQSGRYTGIGLIMGQASGNAEMLEIEGPAGDLAGRLDDVVNEARKYTEIDADQLLSRVLMGFTEISAGGGLHTIIRITDGPALPNTKLAHDGNKVIAETRGEGGFVIVWPTAGRTGHEPGAAYVLERGGPDSVAEVTSEDRDLLHEVFTHALDKTGPPVVEAKPAPAPSPAPASSGLSPLDDYAQRVTWDEILQTAGWTYSHTDGKREHWTRPGKNKADGASGNILDGCLYVHSTSVTDFPINKGLSKGQAYAWLHHGGDLSNATKALRAAGYGDALPDNSITLAEFIVASPTTDNEPGRERTSWWPRDLDGVISGHETEPDPTHLTRGDGPSMFYSGRVNGLIGESESGKTWVALHATSQELAKGQPVLYLDFEDSAPGIINRLRKLGTTDQHLTNLTYIAPDEGLSVPAKSDLGEALALASASLVIIDGFNAAMTLMGLDINSNNDATQFAQVLLKPIAATGACVVYVDHVPKSREARGKGGIGAQAKRAMTTGCALTVTVTEPFGEGQAGRLHLTVDKDRPGKVRARSYAAKHAGDVVITPHGKGIRIAIQPSDATIERSTEDRRLQENIMAIVKANPNISRNKVEQESTGKGTAIRATLDHLTYLGKLQETKAGGSRRYIVLEDLDALPVFDGGVDD